jgi:hypothetical protein
MKVLGGAECLNRHRLIDQFLLCHDEFELSNLSQSVCVQLLKNSMGQVNKSKIFTYKMEYRSQHNKIDLWDRREGC